MSMSEEQRNNISIAMKKLWQNKNYVALQAKAHVGKYGMNMLGKHHTEETKQKISLSKNGRVSWIKGKTHSPEVCAKLSASLKGRKLSEEHKRNIGLAGIGHVGKQKGLPAWNKGVPCTIEQKEKNKHAQIARMSKPEIRAKNVEGTKRYWDGLSLEEQERKTQYRMKQCRLLPNKPEKFITALLQEMFPNEWRYTGDFSFMIAGKAPDFTNINGQKKLIELYGDYWHKGQNPQDRIDIFKPFGWDTLVIWECELKNIKKLKCKLKQFALGGV